MECRLPDSDSIARDDLELLRNVAREAGALALNWFERGAQVWEKSPNNPVTQADIAVNDRIAQRLMAARPTYGWLSEETKDDAENRDMSRVFVVDPIDGTKAFIAGQPFFCVAIARLEQDVPIVGVVYNPATDEMFEAMRGDGARLNGEPIEVRARHHIDNCRMLGHREVFAHEGWSRPWPQMKLPDIMPNALAYRIALVAAGRWDAAVALSHKCDWDLAAATLILEEAGGTASDHLGDAFSFNGRIPVQRSVVAAGAALHPLIIERVRNVPIPDPNCVTGESVQGTIDLSKNEAAKMSTKAPESHSQLLHLVIGGELKDVTGIEFEDLTKMEFVGAFGSYAAAYDAWKSAAQRTVDNAEMRFFILHAHRLLDPETGHTHDV